MTPFRPSLRRKSALAVAAALALCAIALAWPTSRHALSSLIPRARLVELNGLRFGYRVERELRLPMPDGVHLATSLYLPRGQDAKLATVLVRLPYGRLEYGEGLTAAEYFARRGYAVVVQDLRGTSDSEGELVPYRSGTSDGTATLDWIAAQPWSNGRVGTFGCSALGESQYVLARSHHPALRAMIPLGAGGAIGSAAGRHGYFGVYEGGIFELASGFGWFVEHGAKSPRAAAAAPFDIASAVRGLPVADLVQRHRPAPNGYDDFMRMSLADPAWHALGYFDDTDRLTAPSLEVTTWGDQTVGDTLAVDAQLRRASDGTPAPERHLIVAPGTHCHAQETGDSGRYGDIDVPHSDAPWFEWYERWFDHWLRDRGDGLAGMAPIRYYMMGEGRWLDAPSWPPPQAQVQRWYLDGGGHANGAQGDGVLAPLAPAQPAHDDYVYDPNTPVPSRGGPLCCTGNPADRAGPVDQKDVESRPDVLVYTSRVLDAPLRIAGPLRASLRFASSAVDTDVVARLTDVWPDGHATNIQEGALRTRYRGGFAQPRLMAPGEPVTLAVDMRSIGYTLPAGHRLRLVITSSSFPRLERNLNTGGDNARETTIVVARNRVLHGPDAPSYVELPLLPPATD
ncbi:MAG: CocE/NonD family hydrolase [Betaproteobacteria bacterium]